MFKRLASLVLLLSISATTLAQDVQIRFRGQSLNANLVMADGKSFKDGVILMTHGTLAHGKMEIMAGLQNMFRERGLNTLSITLGLGLDNRSGMYDCKVAHRHKHTDALDEIGAWLNWLKQKGVRRVILFGHSRGGNQTAWFASEHDDAVIKAVILAAPATWDQKGAVQDYKKNYKKDLGPILARAEKMLKEGKGKDMMEHVDFIYCPDATVQAESFVAYYRPDSRRDTPSVLRKIKKPVLVFAGSNDQVVKGLPKKMSKVADGKHIQLKVIEGAGHFFRDLNSEDMADAIVEYLKQIR